MKKLLAFHIIILLFACNNQKKQELTAQQIVDKSIEVSGGELYDVTRVSFMFRGMQYISEGIKGKEILERIATSDSIRITDVKDNNSFKRFLNDSLVQLPDTMSIKYANSVNSVHYFARLPYGLNDPAVRKELIEETTIKDKKYYKVKVTFDEDDGGEDFDDIYFYWFNKETFKPDFLAYKFHVDGGGIRFREAYNERYIGDIRFVDYTNLKPKEMLASIFTIDSLYKAGGMELLSKIELDSIEVGPEN